MQQGHVELVDLLDVLAHPLAGLVEALRVVNDGGLKIGAVVVVAVQLVHVLVGEDLVVEGDWVLVGLEAADDLVEGCALIGVGVVLVVVALLGLQVGLVLLEEQLALLLQALLELADLLAPRALQAHQVELRVLLDLHRELPGDLGHVDHVVRAVGGVEAVLDHPLLEPRHLLVHLLREGAVQLLHLRYKLKQLVLHLLDVLHPPQQPLDVLHQTSILFYRQHLKVL